MLCGITSWSAQFVEQKLLCCNSVNVDYWILPCVVIRDTRTEVTFVSQA